MERDLFALLDNELKIQNITEEEEIQNYFYRRCGQLFSFDPEAVFGENEYKEYLKKVRLNIRNIQTYEINCFIWSYLFVDLLNAKGIKAEVTELISKIDGKSHAFVISCLKTGKYVFDLTARFKDIMRIKYGFATDFPKKVDENSKKENEKKNYFSQSYVTFETFREQVIKKLNCDIEEDNEVKSYKVLKCIESIVNNPIWESRNIDYFSGIQFIDELIEGIIKRKKPKHTFYTNKEQNFYTKVYSLAVNGSRYYFAYQKEENGYKLREVTWIEVEEIEAKSNHTCGLKLIKKEKQLKMAV